MPGPTRAAVSLGAAVLLAGCAREVPRSGALPCGTSRELTGNGIGDFRIGMSVDSLRLRCHVVADSTNPQGVEGMPERRVTVRFDSSDVGGIVVDGAVQRLDVEDGTFRTATGLGVGTTMADLRSLPLEVFSGEGNVAAVSPQACGLSFLLALRPVPANPTAASVPDSIRVRKVLVIGCDSTTAR